jgi:hypothetical protein
VGDLLVRGIDDLVHVLSLAAELFEGGDCVGILSRVDLKLVDLVGTGVIGLRGLAELDFCGRE